jgi:hypothetical protein
LLQALYEKGRFSFVVSFAQLRIGMSIKMNGASSAAKPALHLQSHRQSTTCAMHLRNAYKPLD